jgi:hypothetical protein
VCNELSRRCCFISTGEAGRRRHRPAAVGANHAAPAVLRIMLLVGDRSVGRLLRALRHCDADTLIALPGTGYACRYPVLCVPNLAVFCNMLGRSLTLVSLLVVHASQADSVLAGYDR